MNNPIKAITTVVLLLFSAFWQAPAQRLSDRYFGISEQDFVDTIKIKMWEGAIIVPVEIEGETKNLMFDTGARTGFWIGEEEPWMQPMGASITTRDAQNRTKKKAMMKIPSLKMGHLTIKGYPVVVDDGLGNYTCGIIDGAFGFDLVSKGISFKFDTRA